MNKKIINNLLDKKYLIELSRINSFKSSFKILFELVFIVLIVIVTLKVWDTNFVYIVYPISIILIATRQLSLLILIHESAHYVLMSNRILNDIVGNLLGSLFFISMGSYRNIHNRHHKEIFEDNRPKSRTYKSLHPLKSWYSVRLFLFKLLFGLKNLIILLMRFSLRNTFYFILFVGIGSLIITYFEMWTILFYFWLIPLITVLNLLLGMLELSEHYGLSYKNIFTSTRTIKTNFIENFFFAPNNSSYHLEHHLFPSVPFYNLPILHNELIKNTIYKDKAHITNGYFSMITEVIEYNKRRDLFLVKVPQSLS